MGLPAGFHAPHQKAARILTFMPPGKTRSPEMPFTVIIAPYQRIPKLYNPAFPHRFGLLTAAADGDGRMITGLARTR
jgi:hypothetical protein